jgi:sporulation protein YlmC with PRC-barrel domain
VRLRRRRHALLVRTNPAHRLRDLLEMEVRTTTGAKLGSVLDVRLDERQRVTDFVVGPGRPGSLLGYDRNRAQGPWLIATIVRWLHRHAGCVSAEAAHIDWSAQVLTLDRAPVPLRPA